METPLLWKNPRERRFLLSSIFGAPPLNVRALIDPPRGAIRGASGSTPDSKC